MLIFSLNSKFYNSKGLYYFLFVIYVSDISIYDNSVLSYISTSMIISKSFY